MTGFEWQSAAVVGVISAIVNYLFYVGFRLSEERREQEHQELKKDVKTLSEQRVTNIERDIDEEAQKRKAIYERIEHVEIDYMPRKDCEKLHLAVNQQVASFNSTVLKLEGVAVSTSALVQRIDDMTTEQISLGKDLAALTASLESLRESR